MKHFFYLASIVLLLCTFPLHALNGAVVDQDGNGVSNSTVLLNANGQKYVTYTAANGSFLFNVAEGTEYSLQAVKTGYGEVSSSGTSDSSALNLVVQLEPVLLFGRILTSDGDPIPFAIIDGGTLGTRVSNTLGEFSFSAQYGQSYSLAASKPDLFFNQQISGILQGDTERIIVGVLD